MDSLHKINSSISSFLPPVDQLPEFKLKRELLEGNHLFPIYIIFFKINSHRGGKFSGSYFQECEKRRLEQNDGTEVTYGQLISNSNSFANALLSL